jgi:phosphonopyruvate decarboxylase
MSVSPSHTQPTAAPIDASDFLDQLQAHGVRFFSGVPDSLLKAFSACVTTQVPGRRHVIACNEGAAVALAIGHHLATGDVPLVYLQNSGMGHAANPLASLADRLVYGIPMLLLIGWRGEMRPDGQQCPDEPQHARQGRITLQQLEVLGIAHEVIEAGTDHSAVVARSVAAARADSAPVALVVRQGAFAAYRTPSDGRAVDPAWPSREEAIAATVAALPAAAVVVSTTGMASRELFEIRRARAEGHERDFLTVGGMGHASQIACGIALARPTDPVVCLDGDGAVLMHMGGLPYCARTPNLVHVVINNGAHDSVGGQPTLAQQVSLAEVARACGYHRAVRAGTLDELNRALGSAFDAEGSLFIEVLCRTGNRPDLGRPTTTPAANKAAFMHHLNSRTHSHGA